MIKKIFALLLMSAALCAEELIVNQEFMPSNMQKTQAMGWYAVKNKVNPANTPCVFGDNMAKLSLAPGERGVTLLHKNPPMVPGKNYTISFEAKGTAAQLNCYFEWIYADKKWGNGGTNYIKITKDWDKYSFKFTMPPAGKKYHSRPYLAIGLRSAGEVFLRKVSIKESIPELLKNPEFKANKSGTIASGWRVIPNKIKKGNIACRFADGAAKLSVEPGEQGVFLVQREIPFVPGEQYQIAFEYKGEKNTQLRNYLEWIYADGKWGNIPARVYRAENKWQSAAFVFSVPDNGKKFKTTPYLVFSLNKPGKCSLRNVSVVVLKKKAVISDPGFDSEKNTPWKLQKNASIDKKGGRKSPGVLCLKGRDASAKLVLKLEGGKNYRVGYHVRGMENPGSDSFAEYKAVMRLKSAGRVWGNGMQDCFILHWQSRGEIIRVPAGKGDALEIVLTSYFPGKVQFDDFSVEEVNVEPEKFFAVTLKSPYFSRSFYSSRPEKTVEGTVILSNELKNAAVSFNGKKLALKHDGKKQTFCFPADKLAVGRYDLTFTGKLANGQNVTEKITIQKLAPAKNEVVIGSDRKMYVNGKPFFFVRLGSGRFPMTLWPYGMHDVADYYMARTGLSCTFPMYMEGIKSFLDECHKKGIKANCRLEVDGTWAQLKDEAKFRKYWEGELEKIKAIKDHPALLSYYPYDEPLWNGFPERMMKYTYETLKALDPYHPVIICEAPRGTVADWKPYAGYCDIFGVDIYPVGSSKHSALAEKGLRSVGEYTKLCLEAMSDHGSVDMILQGFSWGNSKRENRSKFPYPTREEFRFMNFDALLHGAGSLGYYVYQNYDPGFEKLMYEELCLLNRIYPVLLNGKKLDVRYQADENMLVKTFEYNKGRYIFVLNRADKAGKINLQQAGKKLYLHTYDKSEPVRDRNMILPPLTARIFATVSELPQTQRMQKNAAMEKRLPEYFRKVTNMTSALKTKAFWIWGGKSDICCATKVFQISGKVKSARILSTADDSYMLYINGKAVQAGGFWMQYQETDLTPYLKQGRNVLAFYAANRGGAAGILADLELTFDDGRTQKILSDKSWKVSDEVPAGNWLKNGISGGLAAVELFPFGKGPWKR